MTRKLTVIVHFAPDHEESATNLLQYGETRCRQEWQRDCNDAHLDAYEEAQVAMGWRMHVTVVDHYKQAAGCAVAWLLLLVSAAVHALHYCKGDECESDEDETPSTMYS